MAYPRPSGSRLCGESLGMTIECIPGLRMPAFALIAAYATVFFLFIFSMVSMVSTVNMVNMVGRRAHPALPVRDSGL